MKFDKKFKDEFKIRAFDKKENFIRDLSKIFDLEGDHFCHILLTGYHSFYPEYSFEKKGALLSLNTSFEDRGFYMYQKRALKDLQEK